MAPRRTLAFALVAALPLGGCCSFARFFCGPDRTPWISVDYTSPEDAVRTMLEALRRDDPDIVYESLSDGYRQRHGLDLMSVQVFWERFRDANPGLHVAGYAKVPTAERPAADRAVVRLEIEGHRLEVQLVRQDSWLVRYARPQVPGGEPTPPGKASHRIESFAGFVRVEADGDPEDEQSRVLVAPLRVRHAGVELTTDAIEAVALQRVWKIADLQQRTD
jgi:hypothetical protein